MAEKFPIFQNDIQKTLELWSISLEKTFNQIQSGRDIATSLSTSLVSTDVDTVAEVATQLNKTNSLINQIRTTLLKTGINK